MQKIENLIQEPLKERLKEVTSKPKRRRMKPQIVASTEEHRKQVLGEIKALDKAARERGEIKEKVIPVLFLWGKPVKKLNHRETITYLNLGSRIEYLSETEITYLNIK